MSNEMELKGAAEIVVVDGVRFTELGVVFPPEPSEQQIREAGGKLRQLRRALDWCEGDVLGAWVRFIMERDEAENGIRARNDEHAAQMEMDHITAYAENTGADSRRLLECSRVAEFFPKELRREALGFEHHAEVLSAFPDDLALANRWLDRAVENGWSAGELRRKIRESRVVAPPPEPGSAAGSSDVDRRLNDVTLWASKMLKRAVVIKEEEARELLARLRGMEMLIVALKERAG
jgi:hypothetical protein